MHLDRVDGEIAAKLVRMHHFTSRLEAKEASALTAAAGTKRDKDANKPSAEFSNAGLYENDEVFFLGRVFSFSSPFRWSAQEDLEDDFYDDEPDDADRELEPMSAG